MRHTSWSKLSNVRSRRLLPIALCHTLGRLAPLRGAARQPPRPCAVDTASCESCGHGEKRDPTRGLAYRSRRHIVAARELTAAHRGLRRVLAWRRACDGHEET